MFKCSELPSKRGPVGALKDMRQLDSVAQNNLKNTPGQNKNIYFWLNNQHAEKASVERGFFCCEQVKDAAPFCASFL